MAYSKALVTIDLDEYKELKEIAKMDAIKVAKKILVEVIKYHIDASSFSNSIRDNAIETILTNLAKQGVIVSIDTRANFSKISPIDIEIKERGITKDKL